MTCFAPFVIFFETRCSYVVQIGDLCTHNRQLFFKKIQQSCKKESVLLN